MTVLVWLDLETTGLSPHRDHILEVAVKISDLDRPFETTAAYETVIGYYTTQRAIHGVAPFVREMHTKSGLWDACRASSTSIGDAEEVILSLVPKATNREETPILAGASVHFDLSFLRVHMPRLAERLSHRVYDVSTIKLFCQSIGMPKVPKAEAHRAMPDVDESLAHAKMCADWVRGQI